MAAGQVGQGERGLLSAHDTGSRHAAHFSHPMADDGLNHLFAESQSLNVFSSFVSRLTPTDIPMPGVERDLLSLTHRRRE